MHVLGEQHTAATRLTDQQQGVATVGLRIDLLAKCLDVVAHPQSQRQAS